MTNLNAALKGRRRARPVMAAYDRLPPGLRRWLAEAVLPWSPESALKVWQRAMRETADEAEARTRCEAAERACLAREEENQQATRSRLAARLGKGAVPGRTAPEVSDRFRG